MDQNCEDCQFEDSDACDKCSILDEESCSCFINPPCSSMLFVTSNLVGIE